MIKIQVGPECDPVTILTLFLVSHFLWSSFLTDGAPPSMLFELCDVNILVAPLAALVVELVAAPRSTFVRNLGVAGDARLREMRTGERIPGFLVIGQGEQRGQEALFRVTGLTAAAIGVRRKLPLMRILVTIAARRKGDFLPAASLPMTFLTGHPGVQSLEWETRAAMIKISARDI